MIDTFMTLAEISIGFAGFLAIIIALGGIDSRSDSDQFRINQLLSITFGCLFLALLPVLLHYYQYSERDSIRYAALGMAIYGGLWKLIMLPWYVRLKLWREDGVVAPLGAVMASTGNMVVQIYLYLGFFEHVVAVYFSGLIYYLIGGVISLFVAVRKQRASLETTTEEPTPTDVTGATD